MEKNLFLFYNARSISNDFRFILYSSFDGTIYNRYITLKSNEANTRFAIGTDVVVRVLNIHHSKRMIFICSEIAVKRI